MSKLTDKLNKLKKIDVIFRNSFDKSDVLNDEDFKIYFIKNKLIWRIKDLFKLAINFDQNIIKNFLDFLVTEEKEWIDFGIDDGYYVYFLLDDFLKETVKTNNVELNLFILDYIAKNFIESFKEEAVNKRMDYELGLDEKPSIYYQINDEAIFGSYIQTSNLEKKPIEWYIIDRDNKTITLFSKYGLDNKKYSKPKNAGSWKTSDVREWLNDDFYNSAFNIQEKIGIVDIITKETINNEEITSYDKVSLLDFDKAAALPNNQRIKTTTDYTKKKLESTRSSYDTKRCWWWVKKNK